MSGGAFMAARLKSSEAFAKQTSSLPWLAQASQKELQF